jgi:hypothetical protein
MHATAYSHLPNPIWDGMQLEYAAGGFTSMWHCVHSITAGVHEAPACCCCAALQHALVRCVAYRGADLLLLVLPAYAHRTPGRPTASASTPPPCTSAPSSPRLLPAPPWPPRAPAPPCWAPPRPATKRSASWSGAALCSLCNTYLACSYTLWCGQSPQHAVHEEAHGSGCVAALILQHRWW